MYCPRCGTQNSNSNKVCIQCGKPLPQLDAQPEEVQLSATRQRVSASTSSEQTIFSVRPTLFVPIALFVLGIVTGVGAGALIWWWYKIFFAALRTIPENSVLTIVVAAALLVIAGFSLRAIVETVRCRRTSYTLTNRRVIMKRGIIRRVEKSIPILKVQNVTFRGIGPLGSVVVRSDSRDGAIIMRFVPNPRERADEINDLLNEQG
jgi:membrane protein YdbS with pleckstrin-like domain